MSGDGGTPLVTAFSGMSMNVHGRAGQNISAATVTSSQSAVAV